MRNLRIAPKPAANIDWSKVPQGVSVRAWCNGESSRDAVSGRFVAVCELDKGEPFYKPRYIVQQYADYILCDYDHIILNEAVKEEWLYSK